MALSGGVIAAIVICSLLGPFLMLGLILLLSRWYQRRITAGSDNLKQLQGKTVVITGKRPNNIFISDKKKVLILINMHIMIHFKLLLTRCKCRYWERNSTRFG